MNDTIFPLCQLASFKVSLGRPRNKDSNAFCVGGIQLRLRVDFQGKMFVKVERLVVQEQAITKTVAEVCLNC